MTWILQSEKSLISDFDHWYRGWQDKMRADPIMRWLIEARNTVVKQGDLEAESVATAKLVYTYQHYENEITDAEFQASLGEAAAPSISVPPSTTMADQEKILLKDLPAAVIRDGFIQFERRWIDSKLPDTEILEACAHAYGMLSLVVADLHERMGFESGMGVELGGHLAQVASDHPQGRSPCMIAPKMFVVRRRIRDGSLVEGGARRIQVSDGEKLFQKAKRRYSLPEPPEDVENVTDLAAWQMAKARAMLSRDKHHGQFALLYKGVNLVTAESIAVTDQADKIVVMTELAQVVERSGIDGVIMISDSWIAPITIDPDGFPVPAREYTERREALNVDAIDAYNRRKHLVSFYSRQKGPIVFDGEPIDITGSAKSPFLAPILAAWRRHTQG